MTSSQHPDERDRIKVLVVDDHQLVRTGTSRLLEDFDDLEIVGQAESGEQAITLVRELSPDVILMDVQMPGMGGLEATRRCLRINPDLKVIAVTVYEEEPFPSQLLQLGAAGYLTKRADVNEMAHAIRTVMTNKRYITAEIAQQLALRPFGDSESSPFESLTGREMQITLLVINGRRVSEISETLILSPKTVNSYRYRIFDKLGIRNDVELTNLAVKHGLVATNQE
jgi:two-component system, NarL family, invasion response regulator UvrY